MRTSAQINCDSQLAKSLAAEDIHCGDIVAVLDMVYEFPSFLWNSEPHLLAPEEPVCVRLRADHTGKPLKVKAICLPYVLVKAPSGRYSTIDMRRCRVVRLSKGYAATAWKQLRRVHKSKRS